MAKKIHNWLTDEDKHAIDIFIWSLATSGIDREKWIEAACAAGRGGRGWWRIEQGGTQPVLAGMEGS